MNAELKRRILSDSGIGVPFAQTKILNLNLEYAMTTRVIALDLDGTLLTPKKTLLPSSIEALARAREAGYQLIIVTGRHHVAIHPFYQALALDTPAICCNGTYLYDYHAKTVLEADPMPVNKALQLIEMLNEHHIHGLMYVDDAMVYEHPTGHVIRTSNWAQTLPPEQRPTFTQVASLAETAQQVNAVWKFALTHDDLPQLQHFGKHVEHELGLECEWSWHDQVDIARGGNSKGKRLTKWVEGKAGRWKTSWHSAITLMISVCWKPLVQAWRWATPMTRKSARQHCDW